MLNVFDQGAVSASWSRLRARAVGWRFVTRYGIALLASIAMDKGHQVQVYDHNGWRLGNDVLDRVLIADEWDVIALGGITTVYGSIKMIVQRARELSPRSLLVLGGGVLTSLPRTRLLRSRNVMRSSRDSAASGFTTNAPTRALPRRKK